MKHTCPQKAIVFQYTLLCSICISVVGCSVDTVAHNPPVKASEAAQSPDEPVERVEPIQSVTLEPALTGKKSEPQKTVEPLPTLEQFREILRLESASAANPSVETSTETFSKLRKLQTEYGKQIQDYLLELANDPEVGQTASSLITDAESQFDLGWDCENGVGQQRDLKLAWRWYSKSAEQGFEPARKRVEQFEKILKTIEQKLRLKSGSTIPRTATTEALSRAYTQMEYLRQTKMRYSRPARSHSSGFSFGLGGLGPAAQARDAGDYAARMAVARDMDELARSIAVLEEQYKQEQNRYNLTEEEQEFATSMGMK